MMKAHANAIAAVVAVVLLTAAPALAAPHPKRAVVVLEHRAGSPDLPAVEQRVAGILRKKTSLSIIDAEDARRRYGRNLDRKVGTCAGEAQCVAEIGKKLEASEVVLVGVSQFGDVILTLQRIDVDRGKVITRVAEAMAQGREPDDAELLRYLQRVMPKSDFLRFGVIRINADVDGATVAIDGKERGKTPIEPIKVRASATYAIRLDKAGYVPFRAEVFVPPDAEVKVDPTLARQGSDAWYKRWWVLTLAGTVAAGAVTAVVLTRQTSDDIPVVIRPF
jgi:hypothetical protein